MKLLRIQLAMVLLLALPVLLAGCAEEEVEVVREDHYETLAPEDLPDIPFPDALTPKERLYLDLVQEGPFTLSQIGADVLVLKFINADCPACESQIPLIKQAYQAIQKRDDLRERVKFLGVMAGNNAEESAAFEKENDLPFPVLPDPNFDAYNLVGNPGGLPFLLIVTLQPLGGDRHVARGHSGRIWSAERLVDEAETALSAWAVDRETRIANFRLGDWRNLELKVSDSYLHRLLRESAENLGIQVADIERVELPGDEVVYRLDTLRGKSVWAKVAGRVKICNVCHNIFFIILFNDEGEVLNYTSIRVTKDENERWSEQDDNFMKERLRGRSLTGDNTFDPDVDSVSSATMSAALVFDSVRRLGDTYQVMLQQGLFAEAD